MSANTNTFGLDKLLRTIHISFFIVGCGIVSGLAFGATPVHAAVPADACFTRTSGTITGYTVGGVNNCPTNVDIPSTISGVTITAIGNNSFLSKGLTALTIPSTVTSIGTSAFQNNQLTSVIIPSSVTVVGASAFRANLLTSITIPSSVTNLGSNAVRDNQLTSITVVGNPATVGNDILVNNPLTSISYNGTTHMIPGGSSQPPETCFAFTAGTGTITSYYLNNLARIKSTGIACMSRDIIIPAQIGGLNVLVIGTNAFSLNSINLTGVVIPNTVVTIGNSAFANNQLTALTLSTSLVTIGNSAFLGAFGASGGNQLTSITLPNSLNTIGLQAFAYNKLTSLVIPNSVTSIGDEAFSVNELSSVTLSTSLTTLSNYIFSSNNITSITIPNSITSVGNFAFSGNDLTSLIIPNSVITIGDNAFQFNDFTSVTIPNSVTSIGQRAFTGGLLTSLALPNSVTSVGDFAFYDNRLTSINLSDSLTSIGQYTFAFNMLTSVVIPDSITTIDGSAFSLQSESGGALDPYTSNSTSNQQAVDSIWFARLYTATPSNPQGITDYAQFGTTELDGSDDDYDESFVAGGHIVNPAPATFSFVDDKGNTLASSITLTGQLSDDSYMNTYLATDGPNIIMPADPYNITPSEQQTANDALSVYYRIGESLSYTGQIISGKIPTPASFSFVLGASDSANNKTFIYGDASMGGILTPSQLAVTGLNLWMVLGGVTAVLLLSVGSLIARR